MKKVYSFIIISLFVFSLGTALLTLLSLLSYPLLFALAVPCAFAAADFLSGLFHWACDTWGKQSMFVIGPTLLKSFRDHHKNQKGIVRHNFVEVNGHNIIVATPFIVAITFISTTSSTLIFLKAWLMMTILGILVTNQIHKWAHSDSVPSSVRFLQEMGLILSPRQHQLHHSSPFASNYCITVGFLNDFLERIHFFRHVENIISFVTGAEPREDER